jgi:hypothetical protein
LGLHEADKAFKIFKHKQDGCIRVIFEPAATAFHSTPGTRRPPLDTNPSIQAR